MIERPIHSVLEWRVFHHVQGYCLMDGRSVSGSLCWPPRAGASGARRPLAGRLAVLGSACATPLLHPGHPPPGPKPMQMWMPWTPPEPPGALSGGLAGPIHALADMACTLLCLLTSLSSSQDAPQVASVVDHLPGSQVDGLIPRVISVTVYLLKGVLHCRSVLQTSRA